MLRVLVTGGRDYANVEAVEHALREVGRLSDEDELLCIHGGARGLDSIADQVALDLGWWVTIYPAEWKLHGKSAGPIRNRRMADTKPDMCIAFPGGRGTADMVKVCEERGIPVTKVDH